MHGRIFEEKHQHHLPDAGERLQHELPVLPAASPGGKEPVRACESGRVPVHPAGGG